MTSHGKVRKREQLILGLLGCQTVREAAAAAQISTRTAQRWLKNPEFRSQFEDAKTELLDSGIMELRLGARAAAATLKKIMVRGRREGARVQAAVSLWRLLLDATTLEDIEKRLSELEAQSSDETP